MIVTAAGVVGTSSYFVIFHIKLHTEDIHVGLR